MDDVEWKPLPSLWPSPAVSTDLGAFMLLVFTQDGAPIWEVRLRAEVVGDDLVTSGGADTFEAEGGSTLRGKGTVAVLEMTKKFQSR